MACMKSLRANTQILDIAKWTIIVPVKALLRSTYSDQVGSLKSARRSFKRKYLSDLRKSILKRSQLEGWRV
jgi:hypothetical protein